MTARSFASCLLLLVATVSVLETTLDIASSHGSVRLHSHARARHHSPLRAPRKAAIGLLAGPAGLPAPRPSGSVVPADAIASLPLVLDAVFVPPRV